MSRSYGRVEGAVDVKWAREAGAAVSGQSRPAAVGHLGHMVEGRGNRAERQ